MFVQNRALGSFFASWASVSMYMIVGYVIIIYINIPFKVPHHPLQGTTLPSSK